MSDMLVVDDDTIVRSIIRNMLLTDGHEVRLACNGLEAILQMDQRPADVVILDIIMPVREGIETLRVLRRKHPGAKVIAISGGGRAGPDGYLQLARRLGAHATLCKPFGREELVAVLQRLAA